MIGFAACMCPRGKYLKSMLSGKFMSFMWRVCNWTLTYCRLPWGSIRNCLEVVRVHKF